MACGGSVRLSAPFVNIEDTNIYAEEGVVAHKLGETCLRENHFPSELVGEEINGWEVTEEMADYVAIYTDYCQSLRRIDHCFTWVERRIDLAPLSPPDEMRGTSDFNALYRRFTPGVSGSVGVLEVVDLKYGQGVTVEVEENPQELYYALGALLAAQADKLLLIDIVRITVVQPRVLHRNGPVRSWEISVEDLLAWTGKLFEAAELALSPNAPLVPGDHCRFCKAAAICPALSKMALDTAQLDFDVVPDGPIAPPAPESLSTEHLARILAARPVMEAWLNACLAYGLSLAEQGVDVPGFKAVEKRANRKWVGEDKEEIAERLAMLGATKEQLIEEKLRSVAQVEKAMGKAKFAKMIDGATDLISKIPSGYTLAKADDVRPALQLGAQNDFEIV